MVLSWHAKAFAPVCTTEIGAVARRKNECDQRNVTVIRLSVDSFDDHHIFVREWADQARPSENEVPQFLRLRLLSVRAFDADGMMLDADVVDGDRLEVLIERLFRNELVSYLHIHNARLGCYAALVERGHCSNESEPEK